MSEYQVADRKDSRALAEFLQKEGQFLLPMVELIETAQVAIDQVIDVTGRATIEAVLQLSAQEIAGPKHQGKAQGAIRWHGQQSGVVQLSNRKLRVRKPRLRHKEQGEEEVPAYQHAPNQAWMFPLRTSRHCNADRRRARIGDRRPRGSHSQRRWLGPVLARFFVHTLTDRDLKNHLPNTAPPRMPLSIRHEFVA